MLAEFEEVLNAKIVEQTEELDKQRANFEVKEQDLGNLIVKAKREGKAVANQLAECQEQLKEKARSIDLLET